MLLALIFPRAQRASTYDISAERNVWLQSALRSFAIVCDYMETGLFAIVCDLRSAIRDRLRSFAIIWKPAFKKVYSEIVSGIATPPTAHSKFNESFSGVCLDWKKIHSLPFLVALDTKSREFQYKNINRYLVTNTFLKKNRQNRFLIITAWKLKFQDKS